MSDRLAIVNEMRELDQKNRQFYNSLTPEEKKKFSTFLMLRWGSCVQGSRELQEYYVQATNYYLNRHFYSLHRHPKLQWLCASAVSPGLGNHKHNWIAPRKKETGVSARRRTLCEIFPHYKDDEIDVMLKINTQKEIEEYVRACGAEK